MRLLYLSQGKTIDTHPGFQDALRKLKAEGVISDFLNIPYLGYAEQHGWEAFYLRVVDLCIEGGFNVVYFQFFHGTSNPTPAACVKALRTLKVAPLIVTSVGDGFSATWLSPDYPQNFKEMSRLADITFSTQMGTAADKMLRWGARNIVLSPSTMCQLRFNGEGIDPANHHFDFDVVWIGSRNESRVFNPFNRNGYAARKRKQLISVLAKRYGSKFGLFGWGWDRFACAQGPVSYDQQQITFRRGRVVVGATPYSLADYYYSDRLPISASSGIPTVEMRVPRLDRIFRDGEHVYFVNSIEETVAKCDELLACDPLELYKKAANSARYIADRHTQYHRLKFEFDTMCRYVANGYKLDVEFPFFLPEVDLTVEKSYAFRVSNPN